MRISDWSSDVCSSDLHEGDVGVGGHRREEVAVDDRVGVLLRVEHPDEDVDDARHPGGALPVLGGGGVAVRRGHQDQPLDRKSVVEGKSVSLGVGVGVRVYLKKNHIIKINKTKS